MNDKKSRINSFLEVNGADDHTIATIIRNNTRELSEAETDDERMKARNTLLSLFPYTGYKMYRKNFYYGIPEMFERPDYKEIEQQVKLELIANMHKFNYVKLAGMADSYVISTFIDFMNKYADYGVKRYIEDMNGINHYYGCKVLHMWKYHNHMTIQGSTDQEICDAIADADAAAKPSMKTVKWLRTWSNDRMALLHAAADGAYSISIDLDEEDEENALYAYLLKKVCQSKTERKAFRMLYKEQKDAETVAEAIGYTAEKLSELQNRIKQAAASLVPEKLRRYSEAQPFLNAGLAAC